MDTTAFDEDDETGEYAPQVVDLTPEQARMLGMEAGEPLHVGMSKTSLHEVKSDDESEDEEGGIEMHARASDEESGEEEEEEEEADLDDMDARF